MELSRVLFIWSFQFMYIEICKQVLKNISTIKIIWQVWPWLGGAESVYLFTTENCIYSMNVHVHTNVKLVIEVLEEQNK